MMNKTALRQKYKALRSHLSKDEIEDYSLQIANQCLKLDIWDFEYYHLFLSIESKKEINTEYLLQIVFGHDANVVIPKMKDQDLEHFLLTDSTKLKFNRWNIPEPENGIPIDPKKLDVVFLPLLAYDTSGNRTGYGKGYYDRFLLTCKKEVVKVGLSFFPPEEGEIEVSTHDIPLDYCVTPQAIHKF